MKIAFVSNIPSPYRLVYFNNLNKYLGNDLIVFYCSKTGYDREWKLKNDLTHQHKFLKGSQFKLGKRHIFINPSITKELRFFNPDVVVTGGFFPTMLLAILYSWINNKFHFINTDGWWLTEKKLNKFHRWIRKVVYRRATGFLPVSTKGRDTIINYGINERKISVVPYVTDFDKYFLKTSKEKKYDLLFIGQFIDRKMPLFFSEVAQQLKIIFPDIRVLILGNGPLKEPLIESLQGAGINFDFPGFVQPSELPELYSSCKILMFPTKSDGWGVVANEACSSGVPVFTTPMAGSAGDLIINGYNGYVLEPEAITWAEKANELITNEDLYNTFSANAIAQAKKFHPDKIARYCLDEIERICSIEK